MKNARQLSVVYAALLGLAGFALLVYLSAHTQLEVKNAAAVVGFTLFGIVVVLFGFPAPHVGHVSLDRVVQVSSILIFGTLQAAWIAGISSVIWPFLPWGANRGQNLRLTVLRSFHNSGMIILLVLMTGSLYTYFGGHVPLTELDLHDGVLILILSGIMQFANNCFVAVIAWMEEYDWRRAFGVFSTVVDIAGVPLAVFTALVYNRLDTPVFVLFLVVLALIILIVKSFADTRRALEIKVDELVAVNRVGRAVSGSLVLDDLIELIFRESRNLLEFDSFMLALYAEEARELDIRLHHNRQGRQVPRSRKLGEGLLSWVVSNNKPVFITDWSRDESEFKSMMIHIGDTPQTQSFIAVPVTYRERVLGVLSVQGYTPDMFTDAHFELVVTFAGQVAVAIANARLFEELEKSRNELERRVVERTHDLALQKDELHALTESLRSANREKEELLGRLQQQASELERQSREDGLTGLYNRRYLDNRLDFEVKRAQRYNRQIALAMADVDRFKGVNDKHSHMVGDDVLRTIANILRNQCRSIDIIARYGGEEFLLCFPETSHENAVTVCEKIRKQVEEYDWSRLQPGLQVTLSVGLTAAPPEYDVDALIAAADEKLYEAKRGGRNRVCA
ncbi:MAG TPA: diguanylate cyclase [Gammaproteobacteria bacterium]|nr:diguanylate cyclase [Gammaproteobacteria bacterium]